MDGMILNYKEFRKDEMDFIQVLCSHCDAIK